MAWPPGRRSATIGAVVVVLLLGGVAAWAFLAPKPTQMRDEAAPTGTTLREGSFVDGDALHEVSGTVRLLSTAEGNVLRFESYRATSGPDVFLYLTPKSEARSAEDVEGAGVRIRTPTMTGQATLRGDFNLEVPEGVDIERYAGVAVWCDTYNVLFGWAALGTPP